MFISIQSRHPAPVPISARLLSSLSFIFILFLFTLLGGCNSNGNTTSSANGNGEVVVGLTDARGDFATYTVDVLSLKLTRSDGTVVETLPLKTRVDFSRYTDLTEFLTAATIPNGVYTKATMVLDYSAADIQVEDQSGNAVPVTNIVDIDGKPITTLTVSVQLGENNKLVVAPGIPANITLDYNLKASNRVDFSTASPVLTVAPFMVADVALTSPKPHRLRGPLASVDPANENFSLFLRPFHHILTGSKHRFGRLKVHTTTNTVYEINGVAWQGQSGIQALDKQNSLTAVIVRGKLGYNNNHRAFIATQVYAGSSVPNGTDDVATGYVIARTGNTLTLKGVTLLRTDGSVVFNNTIQVKLADTTVVKKQLSTALHTIGEISVGQRLTVFGQISGNTTTGFTLDAGNGKARMLLTTVNGTVAQTDSPLAVNLSNIGHRDISLFNFSGTGVNTASDANPAFYEINTGSLNLTGIILNEPIKVRGFVRDFGMAPEDFDAHTLIRVSQAEALMIVSWNPASTTAITEASATRIILNLTGSGRFHHLVRAGVRTDLTGLTPDPVLLPNASAKGMFVIIRQHIVRLFRNFAQFSQTLTDYLTNGASVKTIKASGHFNDDTLSMSVNGIRVVLQ